ncbi:MAG TPA: radical SAM protein [Chondromyces sp.]|nr:radical SAM protein [Chondromyces sp.]
MGFSSVALLQAHQRIPAVHDYYVPDLVELCGLAAMVREEVDDLAIPVAPTDRAPFATFESFMRRRRLKLVGISVFTAGARSAAGYAEIAKKHGAFVVLGGYHPSALPDEVLALPHVDAVVRGQGELTFAELVGRGSPEGVAGVSYRDDGRIVHNPDCLQSPVLDELPLPLRELRPERFGRTGLDYHTDTVYGSRGCRGRCVFCANHLVGGSWRGRSIDSIVAELESLTPPRRGPWKYVKFWDSTFLADADRVAELCRRVRELGLERHFRFVAETRAEDVVRAAPILRDMRAAGFVRIGCGVESPSRETHRALGKGLNLAHVGQAARLLREANMQMSKFLIVGHEHESADDILAYPDYALRDGVKLHNTTFFVMTPYPGTDLARDYHQKGLVDSRDWDLYTNFGAVVTPGRLSSWRLQVLYAAVSLRYGVTRRFLAGGSSTKALAKALEPLLLLVSVGAARRDLSPDEVAVAVSDAVAAAVADVRRDARPGRSRGARVALVIHAPGRAPVTLAVLAEGERERLFIGTADRLPPGRRRLAVHLQAAELVSLAARIDYRRLTADALTLAHTPRAVRLRCLTGLAGGAIRVLAGLARVGAFSLRHALSPRGRRPNDDKGLD